MKKKSGNNSIVYQDIQHNYNTRILDNLFTKFKNTFTNWNFYFAVSFKQFLQTELTRGYQLEHDEKRFSARREKIYSFFKIPREVEKFMTYGFFQVSLRSFVKQQMYLNKSLIFH